MIKDEVRFIEAKEQGFRWMLVSRDMYDAFDDDGGVYFPTCKTRAEVDEKVKRTGGDQKVMGIYDLNLPLKGQGPGISAEDWEMGA